MSRLGCQATACDGGVQGLLALDCADSGRGFALKHLTIWNCRMRVQPEIASGVTPDVAMHAWGQSGRGESAGQCRERRATGT